MYARLGAKFISVVPVLDTAIYASGDQMGTGPLACPAFKTNQQSGILESVTIIDGDKESAAFDILFFSKLPTFAGSQNNAFAMTDAQMAASLIGIVSVAAADYKDVGNQTVQTIKAIGMLMKTEVTPTPPQEYQNIWLGLVCRGTPTYTTASDMTIRLGLYNH